MDTQALFLSREGALNAAIAVSQSLGYTPNAQDVQAYRDEKRGQTLGWSAFYRSGPRFYPVFEDQIEG